MNTKQSLPDVQNSQDERNIPLQKVGVSNVKLPFDVAFPGETKQRITATVDLSVNLHGDKKGTNMSRLIEQLVSLSEDGTLGLDMQEFLEKTLAVTESQEVYGVFQFDYFVEKQSPISEKKAPMAYQITLRPSFRTMEETALVSPEGEEMILPADEVYEVELEIAVLAANCCPCSRAISDSGAHNQRIGLTANFWLDGDMDFGDLSVSEIITRLEDSASCPLYPVLKRPDEKYVTERQYNNPKFAEDVARDAVERLSDLGEKGVLGYELEVEAQESIHTHNAFVKLEQVFE